MQITKLEPGDRARWTELWRAYLRFYATELPDEIYEATWSRIQQDRELHALAARSGGEIVAITHFLFHPSCWTLTPVCYLQDLFTDQARRGQGAGRALIEAVATRARAAGTTRLYWLTQAHNATARALYDKIAKHSGFIRYEYPL
ncbi:MAG TPA: GNAT family N-acetyltransferase [Acetobacteraceae bacterium]|jgi:GNAT superfamily N-acetyltransferase|nr:GNAT family N-acetyltransferase [Acetobacteraceae bacterium]